MNSYESKWIKKVREILDICDLNENWRCQNVSDISYDAFKKRCKSKLRNWYKNSWLRDVSKSKKCFLYKEFKTELSFETYLLKLKYPYRDALIKFRTSNHRLPIEVGRHNNIVRSERICPHCNTQDIGDEFHYFSVCPIFFSTRMKFFPKMCLPNSSVKRFCDILASNCVTTIARTAKFANVILKKFK